MSKYETCLQTKLQKAAPEVQTSHVQKAFIDIMAEAFAEVSAEFRASSSPQKREFANMIMESLADTVSSPATEAPATKAPITEAPVEASSAPPPPKLAPGQVLVVRQTNRAHSSGSETTWSNVFGSYEAASKSIISNFEPCGLAQDYWSEDQYECSGYQLTYGIRKPKKFPRPTLDYATKKFSPAALEKFVKESKYEDMIYGPYDTYCRHVPYEIHIELCKLIE